MDKKLPEEDSIYNQKGVADDEGASMFEKSVVVEPTPKRSYKKLLLILIPLGLAVLFVGGILGALLMNRNLHAAYKKPEVNKFYTVKQDLKFNLRLSGDSGRMLQDEPQSYTNSTSTSTTFLVVDSQEDNITMLAIVGDFSIEESARSLRAENENSTSTENSENSENSGNSGNSENSENAESAPLPVFIVQGNTKTGQVSTIKSPENTDVSDKNKVISASNQFLVSSDPQFYSDASYKSSGRDPSDCQFSEKYGPFAYCPKFSKVHDTKYTILTKSYDSSYKKLTRKLQDLNETSSHEFENSGEYVPNDDLKINLTRSSYINGETGELELTQESGSLNLNLVGQEGEAPHTYEYQFEQSSSISKMEIDLEEKHIKKISEELVKEINFVEETPDEIKSKEQTASQTSANTQNATEVDHQDRNLGEKLMHEKAEIFNAIGIRTALVMEAELNGNSIDFSVYLDIGGIARVNIAKQSVAGDIVEKVKKVLAFKNIVLNTVITLQGSLDNFMTKGVSELQVSINSKISQLDEIMNDISYPSRSLPNMLKYKLDSYLAKISELEQSYNQTSFESTDWQAVFQEKGYLSIEQSVFSVVEEHKSMIQSRIEVINKNKNELKSEISTRVSELIQNAGSLSSNIILTAAEVLKLPIEGVITSDIDLYDFSLIKSSQVQLESTFSYTHSTLNALKENFKSASLSSSARISSFLESEEDLVLIYYEILSRISEIEEKYNVNLISTTSLESLKSRLTAYRQKFQEALADPGVSSDLNYLQSEYSQKVLLRLVSFDAVKKGILDSLLSSVATKKNRLFNQSMSASSSFYVGTPIGFLKLSLKLSLGVSLDLERGVTSQKAFCSLVPAANAGFEGNAGLYIVVAEAGAGVIVKAGVSLINEVGIKFTKVTGYFSSSLALQVDGKAGIYVKYLRIYFYRKCIKIRIARWFKIKICFWLPRLGMSDPKWIVSKNFSFLNKQIAIANKEFRIPK